MKLRLCFLGVIILISYLAEIITDFFIRYDAADKDNREVYKYGNEIIISTALDFLILFAFAIVFHDFATVFLFWIVFFILRKFGGGYHADTYLKCKIIFSLNILIVLILVDCINYVYNFYVLVLLTMFSCLVIFFLAPIENENKPMTKSKIKSNAHKSKICSVLITVLSGALFYPFRNISFTLVLAHFSVSAAMLYAYMKNKDTE